MIAGYPTGIAPPLTPRPWYNQTRTVSLSVKGFGGQLHGGGGGVKATLKTINSTCANPKALWLGKMKSVTWPNRTELEELRQASQVCEDTFLVETQTSDDVTVNVTL